MDTIWNTLCRLCLPCYLPSHNALEHEATAESSAIQEQLEMTEALLGEKERELTEAREKITSLSEELVVSEKSVSSVMKVLLNNYDLQRHLVWSKKKKFSDLGGTLFGEVPSN